MLTSPTLGGNIDEVYTRMSQLAASDQAKASRRAIFLQVYLLVTGAIRDRILSSEPFFEDKAWAARYLTSFANLYAKARYDYDRGALDETSKAWRFAFQTADSNSGLVLQDLLLGVNSHINHDLALALTEVSIDPDRASRYRDHNRINGILESITDAAEAKISALYAPGLAIAGELAGPLDEVAAAFSIELARENAWQHAAALANARSSFEQKLVLRGLDLKSAMLAKLILAPVRAVPGLKLAFEAAERGFSLQT